MTRRFSHKPQADQVGTFRWYNHYRLPEHLGGGVITVRLHGNDEDILRKFNRTENVRPIPPSDPDFRALYAPDDWATRRKHMLEPEHQAPPTTTSCPTARPGTAQGDDDDH